MLMVHSAMAAMTGAGFGDGYAAFRAHIAGLAASRDSGNNISQFNPSGGTARVIPQANPIGYMTGSSWNSRFQLVGSTYRAVIVHGLATKAIFDEQVALGLEIFLQITSPGDQQIYTGLTRNGFTSDGGDKLEPYPYGRLVKLIRWDPTTQRAMQSDPSVGGSETHYPL